MLEELIVSASVGTARKPPPGLPADHPLAGVLAARKNQPAEAKLLGAVAALNQYEAAGRTPQATELTPMVAAEDSWPLCSRRAGDILGHLLLMSQTPAQASLLDEWLELAIAARRRAPHRQLPALLDYAVNHRTTRPAIVEVVGMRGRFLMKLNTRWQFAADDEQDPQSVWATGSRDQRLAALQRLRKADRAASVELLRSTAKEDAADDRAAFIAALGPTLSAEDEAFLESALDDRSVQVRRAAAELLARLANSAYVRRMSERVDALLTRKPKSGGVEIKLPPDKFDPAWARDAVAEKVNEFGVGKRQGWLMQFVAAVPPSHWSQGWGMSPDECIAAVRRAGEFAEVVFLGLNAATARHPDVKWATALLLAATKRDEAPLALKTLNGLPADAQQALAAEVFDAKADNLHVTLQLLNETKLSLDKRAAAALFRQVERHAIKKRQTYDMSVSMVLDAAATRVPPESHDELADRWAGDKWEANRKALDQFMATLLLRRDLHREFQS